MSQRRVQQEPAWVLHHRPFRDSSRIVDVLSRQYGRLSLVARGSRSARSKLKGILRPFMPLRISWVAKTELGTLTGAELGGQPTMLLGDALLSGYYLNELLLKLLHRHDPQPDIFALYGEAIAALAARQDISRVLRRFEIELLRLIGYALNLQFEARTQAPIDATEKYQYVPEQGAIRIDDQQPKHDTHVIYSGAALLSIGRMELDDDRVLRDANRLLRDVITFHLGGRELNSRKVLIELKRSGLAPREE